MMRIFKRRYFTKVFRSAKDALFDMVDGASFLAGGFGLAGLPENCLRELHRKGLRNLVYISNSTGTPELGPGPLMKEKQIKTVVTSFLGGNKFAESQYLGGELQILFVPQGTLAEKMRIKQAGLGGFYTPTGVGSVVETGGFPLALKPDGTPSRLTKPKEKQEFNNRDFLLENWFDADFSFIRAFVGDKHGNLRYRKAMRNLNQVASGAGKITIAEVENIVDELPPDKIHTPGYHVDRIFEGEFFTKKLERVKIAKENFTGNPTAPGHKLSVRDKIAKRIARDLKDGMYINLGIGIPSEIPPYLPPEAQVTFQVENGLVGSGPYPFPQYIDADLINAGKEPITTIPGYSYSDSSDAFGMMRGKHIHMTVLGGMQVSETGDLANWVVPGKKANGMGGAMDLAASCPFVIVAMEHTNHGQPRIIPKCSYPLTATGCVKRIVTDLAVLDFEESGLVLKEKVPEISLEQLKKITPANYRVDPHLKDLLF